MHEHIGALEQECTTLEEAKAVSEQWHTERYADNDAEFDKGAETQGYGRNLRPSNGVASSSAEAAGSR